MTPARRCRLFDESCGQSNGKGVDANLRPLCSGRDHLALKLPYAPVLGPGWGAMAR